MHSRSAICSRSVEVVWELFDTPTYVLSPSNVDIEIAFRLVSDTDFLSCTYPGYGKNVIKEFKVSPDSYIQMALQLAYYR